MVTLPSKDAGVAAWHAGRQAALSGNPRKAPYAATDILADLWEKGWIEGAVIQFKLHQPAETATR